ncbi:SWIM zinc finger domain-containing protein [Ilumatobacter sp.]|uniref:SWIM zinc finger family protein n=1 Tax=Ilumatobacter sp. TaxID=1967498 RepID=UPI0030A406B5
MVTSRWSIEQVESVAPSAAAVTAAQPLASPSRWTGLGADNAALWGSCQGSGSEPYDTMVDHQHVGFTCTCPSRKTPCKHALALLLLWVRDQVVDTPPPAHVSTWIDRRSARRTTASRSTDGDGASSDTASESTAPEPAASETVEAGDAIGESDPTQPVPQPDRNTARNDRVERMHGGLSELDRWLDDRIRTGLADPSLARYATWDDLAARLVDAQAGSLANRIRRLAGLVGASPGWHDEVLAELGLLHLLSQAGRHLGSLPGPLADAVATSVGWQVKQADVLAGVPDTDHWIVAGRSDVREDRIEVRRHWLRGTSSGRWALCLSFAAYQQSLDASLMVGTSVHADIHRYPGPALRSLVGARYALPVEPVSPPSHTIAEGCDEVGSMLVSEPWLDRLPVTIRARLARSGGVWALADATGSLPVLDAGTRQFDAGLAMLLAVSEGREVDLTVEWTPHGVVPLSIHLPDRTVDIGPRANTSFVSAA